MATRTIFFLFIALLVVTTASARNFKTTLAVDPSPPRVGEMNVVSGCGYAPNVWTRIYFVWRLAGQKDWEGYSVAFHNGGSDCLRQEWTPSVAAVHRIYVYQQLHRNLQMQHYIEFDVIG